jgi:AraC-like DNA-binding protein
MLFWVLAKLGDILLGIEWGYSLLRLNTSFLLYWIGYQGFYHYNIVQDRIQLRKRIARSSKFVGFVRPKQFGNNRHHEEFAHIHEFVTENQKYMESDLSLHSLAETLKMSISHLSKLINTYSSYNFSDYINSLRVEQSKKLLADPNFNHYTIVSIGLECGFNSRSTFYSSFKKFTFKTPSQFLRELKSRPDYN